MLYRFAADAVLITHTSFIAYWLHRLIFFQADPWVFTICYTAFGLLVAATLIFCPPRWRRRSDTPPATVATAS